MLKAGITANNSKNMQRRKAKKVYGFWTEEKLLRVLELWKDKEPEELAMELEMSKSSIIRMAQILREKGFDVPKKRPKNNTDEVVKAFEKKYSKLKILTK